MKKKWREHSARFNALALRERALIAGAVILGGGFLAFSLGIEPHLMRKSAQIKRLVKVDADFQVIDAQIKSTQAQLKDPDAANRLALDQTRKEMAEVDAKLQGIENMMVPPEKMRAFLENLLSKHGKLELLALRTLPPTPLIERAADKKNSDGKAPEAKTKPEGGGAAGAGTPNIYKHGIELRVSGGYGDLLAYLAELERMPQKVVWNKITLSGEKYPASIMTVTVYTLSLDKQWLAI